MAARCSVLIFATKCSLCVANFLFEAVVTFLSIGAKWHVIYCKAFVQTRVPCFISKLNTLLCVSKLCAVVCLVMFVGAWTYSLIIFAIVIGRELIFRVYVCLCVVCVVCVCTCARRAPVRVCVRVRVHMYMYMCLCTCLSMCMWIE